jgi:gas vesicle protein
MVLAFLGGAAIGGAAALLLAPSSGSETRKRIAGAVGDARDVAEQLPQAVRAASGAAQGAFAKSMKEA